jgi:hypothetical protein
VTEPVLVIHGVANRNKKAFESMVEDLSKRLGGNWDLIPVFWGDLGSKNEDIKDTIPEVPGISVRSEDDRVDGEMVEAMLAAMSGIVVRSTDLQADSIMKGASEIQADDSFQGVRAEADMSGLREALGEALPETRFIKHVQDPAMLEAIGRALGSMAAGAPPIDRDARLEQESGLFDVRTDPFDTGGTVDVRSPFDHGLDEELTDSESTRIRLSFRGAKKRVKGMIKQLDNLVGTVVSATLGKANESFRLAVAVPAATFLGDVLVYQRNRDKIHARIKDAISERAPESGTEARPIKVIAHSLGGVISFDAAVRVEGPLHIKALLTFGTQPAFFHVIDPRHPLLAYSRGFPVTLPPTIGRWTNIWEPLDPLAFTVGTVFRLANGDPPKDIPIYNGASRLILAKGWTHSTYWESEDVVQAIKDTFAS